MSGPYRRYEILLPVRFNDGRPVPDELLAETLLELRRRFGAVSCETQSIHGHWNHAGEVFRDDLVRAFIDVEDTVQSREFFVRYKQKLKERFQQIEIWIVSYPMDVL